MIEAVYGLPRSGKTVRMVQQSLTGKTVMCKRCGSVEAVTAMYAYGGRIMPTCKKCLEEGRKEELQAQGPQRSPNPFFSGGGR